MFSRTSMLILRLLIGLKMDLLLLSRIKVNVDHAGLSQLLVVQKVYGRNPLEIQFPCLNNRLFHALRMEEMKDAMVETYLLPLIMLFRMVSKVRTIILILLLTLNASMTKARLFSLLRVILLLKLTLLLNWKPLLLCSPSLFVLRLIVSCFNSTAKEFQIARPVELTWIIVFC